jgi:serine/threonine-protein kinase
VGDEHFGPYRLVRLLGQGGMGEVFEAYDTEQDRTVALKRLIAQLADEPDFQRRFRRECQLASRLNSPHVIPIHRSGEIDGRLFIDMRMVGGRDLAQLLRAEGPLTPARTARFVEQVASALDAAHHAGLVHRDIKCWWSSGR